MICIICRNEMKKVDSPAWTSKYICPMCKTEVQIIFHDLMGGCLKKETYQWYDENGDKLLKYAKMGDGTIKIEEEE